MNIADLAAKSGVDLNVIGDNPVAQPHLEKRAAFVLAVSFGNDEEVIRGLYFTTQVRRVWRLSRSLTAPRLVCSTKRSSAKEKLAGT